MVDLVIVIGKVDTKVTTLENLARSVSQSSNEMRIMFYNPVCSDINCFTKQFEKLRYPGESLDFKEKNCWGTFKYDDYYLYPVRHMYPDAPPPF